ncbi:putative fumarylacetoacetate hydrolase [Exophiala viscosa]|uniref:Fumarylacetoacetate hydrolase n=1 Tax=Exophiala viscosa TaxID=2486360 RepID=A0AAN6E1A2_9EURO|nr:putative fumarylacetoacetate hydrolase [Exophiala viscosa]
MAPSAVNDEGVMVNGFEDHYSGVTNHHEKVQFDKSLAPKRYEIKGTDPNSKILFLDVNILDSTGRPPFRGDVFIEGERLRHIGEVPGKDALRRNPAVRVVDGKGRTLMSGLGDAHTHFSWNNGDLGKLGDVGVEEHTLLSARSAQTYLDSGYTMCFGAASAKERLDCVIRDAINEGHLPGPRYLANGKEMAVPDGDLVPGITAFAKGPLEMRETIRHHVKLGVDQIKLSMSGEQITETRDAQDCYYTDEETAACVDEAHRHGVRLCSHARARDSVKQCIQHGVDIIYHASWIDEEGMDMLEKNKHKHIVAPGINWLIATIYEAGAFGYSFEKAEQVGYKKELEVAIQGLKEMHRRGITVLPGGDYGFAWTPHGTYARDLEHFVKLLGFTPMESIIAATAGVAKLFMREDELGKILPGYYADCILVDGSPLDDITVLQQHDKLNMIIINGRIHKASYKEFLRHETMESKPQEDTQPRNFISYALKDGTKRTRVGHLRQEDDMIRELSFASGTPVERLEQILGIPLAEITSSEEVIPKSSVQILPPITGRDVLAVGKNYMDHAHEFNSSGYDSSDKEARPSHPVIFTKRASSIIAHEQSVYLDEEFTSTLDYEGEIGVIIGKGGYKISEDDAMDHVWGYTIINDLTARERQRDHKQFFIGKSGDTYCPMGPIAVPASAVPATLTVTTHVNGEKRQQATTEQLIFSISHIIKTLSEAQTLRPGDVIAMGTPAGVGIGMKPPTFLKPSDVVEVSITGLGTLKNTVTATRDPEAISARLAEESAASIPIQNLSVTLGGVGLTTIASGKQLNVEKLGSGEKLVVFVHGLGGSTTFYSQLVDKLKLADKYTCVLYDLEGHGLSPTTATSLITISSLADDLHALLTTKSLSLPLDKEVTIVAHSMGCLVAEVFALKHPNLAHRLVLIGPPPCPLPQGGYEASIKRAATVRKEGMRNVAKAVANAGTSDRTKSHQSGGFAAVLTSLLSQDPESYAKGCTALASARELQVDLGQIRSKVQIIGGDEDKVSPPAYTQELTQLLPNATLATLKETGHWHTFEDIEGTASALESFL